VLAPGRAEDFGVSHDRQAAERAGHGAFQQAADTLGVVLGGLDDDLVMDEQPQPAHLVPGDQGVDRAGTPLTGSAGAGARSNRAAGSVAGTADGVIMEIPSFEGARGR